MIPVIVPNIVPNLMIIVDIIHTVAIAIGAFLFLGGLFEFKKLGESRTMMSSQHSIWQPLMMIIAAACLFALPTVIKLTIFTVFGTNSPIGYTDTSSTLINDAMVAIRVLGLGSMVRGFYLLSHSGSSNAQPGNTGKAITHIVGGFLAIHVHTVYLLLVSIVS
jgi:hypothetical protein